MNEESIKFIKDGQSVKKALKENVLEKFIFENGNILVWEQYIKRENLNYIVVDLLYSVKFMKIRTNIEKMKLNIEKTFEALDNDTIRIDTEITGEERKFFNYTLYSLRYKSRNMQKKEYNSQLTIEVILNEDKDSSLTKTFIVRHKEDIILKETFNKKLWDKHSNERENIKEGLKEYLASDKAILDANDTWKRKRESVECDAKTAAKKLIPSGTSKEEEREKPRHKMLKDYESPICFSNDVANKLKEMLNNSLKTKEDAMEFMDFNYSMMSLNGKRCSEYEAILYAIMNTNGFLKSKVDSKIYSVQVTPEASIVEEGVNLKSNVSIIGDDYNKYKAKSLISLIRWQRYVVVTERRRARYQVRSSS